MQDIVVTCCCPNPGSSGSGEEHPLSKGRHRQVSLMEIQKDLIWSEKMMWMSMRAVTEKEKKQSRIYDCLVYLIGLFWTVPLLEMEQMAGLAPIQAL